MMSFTARLKEPSTWAGLSILGLMFGVNPDAVHAVGAVASVLLPFVHTDGGAVAQVLIGLATMGGAAGAVALPEHKPAPAADMPAAPANGA